MSLIRAGGLQFHGSPGHPPSGPSRKANLDVCSCSEGGRLHYLGAADSLTGPGTSCARLQIGASKPTSSGHLLSDLRTHLATELRRAGEVTGDHRFVLAARVLQEPRPSDTRARRDVHIRAAAALLDDSSGRARAQALAAAAKNYAASAWPRHRSSTSCPDEIRGAVQEHLWQAMKAHPTFPSGWRQIFNIIGR